MVTVILDNSVTKIPTNSENILGVKMGPTPILSDSGAKTMIQANSQIRGEDGATPMLYDPASGAKFG